MAVFVTVAISAVLLGVVVGPIPTRSADTSGHVIEQTFAVATHTHDTLAANETALTLEANTTFVAYHTAGTELSLPDGEYDGQFKTVAATQPADLYVTTSYYTIHLESDTGEGEHTVKLMWEEGRQRWKRVTSSHGTPSLLMHSTKYSTGIVPNTTAAGSHAETACIVGDSKVIYITTEAPAYEVLRWTYNEVTHTYEHTHTIPIPTTNFQSRMECSWDGLVVLLAHKNHGSNGGVIVMRTTDLSVDAAYTTLPTILPADAVGGADFGCTVALSANGDILVIGACEDDEQTAKGGAAYVYEWNSTAYNVVGSKLFGTFNPGYLDNFTHYFGAALCVAADGQSFVVGADGGYGATFVQGFWFFRREPGATEYVEVGTQTLPTTPITGGTERWFHSLTCSSDLSIIAAGNHNQKAVWVFERSKTQPDTWEEVDYLTGGENDWSVGLRMSCDGSSLAVAGFSALSLDLFHRDRSTNTWNLKRELNDERYHDSEEEGALRYGMSCDGSLVALAFDDLGACEGGSPSQCPAYLLYGID